MSGTDDRIVSMQFDNEAFERKIAETLKSLEKFQQSLKFTESTQGLEDLDRAASKFSLAGLGTSVEGVSAKFLALSTIAITTLATITTKALEAGAKIAKSLTLDPVMDGFKEYETNMTSIQTILSNTASKGTKLTDVNAALDELNHYADQTIYNFSEMARNIGTFTAAGVDLKTSTASIKGIANLAALSGSNSEQASTAMYQLSQAIAAGTVKLMDWNSVVNAGMGGEVFQKALFESGKAMKTLKDVPIDQTFEQWTKAGNTFRGSLQDGWLTSEVLTKTLSGFTGDLTKAQVMAMGYTSAQADEMLKLGKIGKDAATQVKTLTQLMSTVKESVGSGWSETFRIVVGDFEESKKLFTDINNVISGFVGKSADARNALLKQWKDMGGRTKLIDAFKNAFNNLGAALKPIQEAFRMVFPKTTADQLMALTEAFSRFADALKPSEDTIDKIRRAFLGIFAAFDIAWTVIKEVFGLFKDLFAQFNGPGSGALNLAAKLGDSLVNLDAKLVGLGGIHNFFLKLREFIEGPIEKIKELSDKITDFFNSFRKGEEVSNRILANFEGMSGRASDAGDRFDRLRDIFDRFRQGLEKFADLVKKVLDPVIDWFKSLGDKIAAVLQPGDFDGAVDAVNVGLLGGITYMLKKFFDGGFKDAMKGGDSLVSKIKEMFGGVTDTLETMQTTLKATALMEIAIAMGVLTASIVALSLVDSENLTKALVAISVGFGQLVGVMKLLDKIDSTGSKVVILSASMIAIATAATILSGAIVILAQLDPGQLATGLIGIAGGLAAMVGAIQVMSTDASGLIAGSLAMNAMATSLTIMAGAVKLFSMMSWADIGQGLVGIAGALAIMVVAMHAMPPGSTLAAGLAMIPLATGITILAGALKIFATMSWEDIGQGLVALGGALAIIALAMYGMPVTLPITAAGLVLVGIAVNELALALKLMGTMDLGEVGRGLLALGGMMLILAVGLNAMSGAIGGSIALGVAAVSLMLMAEVIDKLGKMSIREIVTGLGAIAAVFAVLAAAALLLNPVIPSIFALGLSLSLVGAGFALFGLGAILVAKAFEALAKAGKEGTKILIESLKMVLEAIPAFVSALLRSLIESGAEILKSADLLLRVVTVLLGHVLDTIIQLAPKIAEALGAIISAGVKLIIEHLPEVIEAGYTILLGLLKGIKDHIVEVLSLVVDIVVKIVETLAKNAYRLASAAVTLLTAFINALADHAGDIVGAGLNLLLSVIAGVANNMIRIVNLAVDIIVAFIRTIADNYWKLIDAGGDILIQLMSGVAKKVSDVGVYGVLLILTLMASISDNIIRLVRGGADIVIGFLNGLAQAIREKDGELRQAGLNLVSAILSGITFGLSDKAKNVAEGGFNLARKVVEGFAKGIDSKSPAKEFIKLAHYIGDGIVIGLDQNDEPVNSAADKAQEIVDAFQEVFNRIPDSLAGMDDLHPTITPVLDLSRVQSSAKNINGMLSAADIETSMSLGQARSISNALNQSVESPVIASPQPTQIKFEQNNYSPKALSTNDIYKNTNSQIALAKEELKIP